ncbi:tyrosine kinase domain protein [Rhizoctonia solani AG-3 Rhs1AP]|uniref:Tyrosine kinase domain protein n=1 Tax=Rhizoctonia solani AG-3 Rhs1AP TaxID=1086054 RepID=X8J0F3_9AGAM|nr:tyrosine kinase domain protein [Rhizoctonia solani AG-3 Rhs1AP]
MTAMEIITRGAPYGANVDDFSIRRLAGTGELPPRPVDTLPENGAGNIIWNILCKCWSYKPADRPTASHVSTVMHKTYQPPGRTPFCLLGLGVPDHAEFRRWDAADAQAVDQRGHADLVSHFEQRGLTNYTELFHPNNIITVASIADTALANVYRAELLHHEPVAIKCVKHQTPYKKLKEQRAARELSCWSSYTHDNILSLLGFAVVGEEIAMVSPWMINGCVTDYVTHNPDCNRLELCSQLARAIAYIHAHDVVHGDIKSVCSYGLGHTGAITSLPTLQPNVLVSDSGIVKVTDFGVSIMDHQEIEFSVTSSGRGTERWQASGSIQNFDVSYDDHIEAGS